jgi:hypothetical protein
MHQNSELIPKLHESFLKLTLLESQKIKIIRINQICMASCLFLFCQRTLFVTHLLFYSYFSNPIVTYRIVHVKSDKIWDFSTWPSPILIFFCTFAGIRKLAIPAYHVFRKNRLKTIYSGTHFSSFLDFRLIFSITTQSIFAVEPSVWARWKGILIENITKII